MHIYIYNYESIALLYSITVKKINGRTKNIHYEKENKINYNKEYVFIFLITIIMKKEYNHPFKNIYV